MTVKVRKMIRERFGKAPPASVSSGMESAAASDTAPRMPDQLRIRAPFQAFGIGSASRRRLKYIVMPFSATTQRKRAAITVAVTAAA